MGYGDNQGQAEQSQPQDQNPIVEINLLATEQDSIYERDNPDVQYVGSYHKHEDGTLMAGAGQLGLVEDLQAHILLGTVLFRKITFKDLPQAREVVSDLIYKKWFQNYSLTNEEVLSAQTTIRDGIKVVGRTEDEPLVYFKKDRNALENREIGEEKLENIFQYIYDNNITDLENRFSIQRTFSGDEGEKTIWNLIFSKGTGQNEGILLAIKDGDVFTDSLNLAQITKTIGSSSKINPEKAREILDINIFELLPNQPNRQQRINDFFTEFNELIGPRPAFEDVDGDGIGERPLDIEQDEQLRISTADDRRNAFITRTEEQASGDSQNQGKTLESMRNTLNSFLGDVDNVIENYEDQRPEYENKSEGFLKIRKPNQAIILRAPNDELLEFQKNDSYLTDGFTITMWVRFVSRSSEGTLFNFGNPLESDGIGFRLDTKTNVLNEKYYRYIRLMVRDNDGELYDNHFGVSGINRFGQRSRGGNANTVAGAYGWYTSPTGTEWSQEVPEDGYIDRPRSYYPNLHRVFPQVSTEDLDEWYFICATFDPTIDEPEYSQTSNYGSIGNVRQKKEFWLNHLTPNNVIVSNSGVGAKCKVELISRTDLLNARGFQGSSLDVSTSYSSVSGSIDIDVVEPSSLEDIYNDPSLLDGDENGDDSAGGNPPTAGFTKADRDWRTYEVNADVEDTTEEETTYQG